MSSEDRSLPLFPLNMVLFPNATLPLQIFEERYKLMMKHCLEGDSKFGVVLIKAGAEVGGPATPHSTGTVAHISEVNRVEDGRMFISVTGQQRFRIKSVTQSRPYMAAEVELLVDDDDPGESPTQTEAVRQAAVEHVRLALGLRGGWVREPHIPSDPAALSYFIGGMLQIGLPEKQTLLEEPATAKRLELELEMLRREADAIKRRVTLELRRRISRQ